MASSPPPPSFFPSHIRARNEPRARRGATGFIARARWRHRAAADRSGEKRSGGSEARSESRPKSESGATAERIGVVDRFLGSRKPLTALRAGQRRSGERANFRGLLPSTGDGSSSAHLRLRPPRDSPITISRFTRRSSGRIADQFVASDSPRRRSARRRVSALPVVAARSDRRGGEPAAPSRCAARQSTCSRPRVRSTSRCRSREPCPRPPMRSPAEWGRRLGRRRRRERRGAARAGRAGRGAAAPRKRGGRARAGPAQGEGRRFRREQGVSAQVGTVQRRRRGSGASGGGPVRRCAIA